MTPRPNTNNTLAGADMVRPPIRGRTPVARPGQCRDVSARNVITADPDGTTASPARANGIDDLPIWRGLGHWTVEALTLREAASGWSSHFRIASVVSSGFSCWIQ